MAQPNENDLKQRDSQSTITRTVVNRVNGVATTETVTTRTTEDELIYKNGKWTQQGEETVDINNL